MARIHTTWLTSFAVLAAIAPYALIYAAHLASPMDGPTGFIQYDMPYYVAAGREAFDGGNWIFYSNPYAGSDPSPAVYVHWLLLILGASVSYLAIDPGAALVMLGAGAAVSMALLTLQLVRHVLGADRRHVWSLFFLAMWGGGVLCLTMVLNNAYHGRHLAQDLFHLDPARGTWFLNWGRNMVYPTEAVYHTLMAGSWLLALRRRYWASLGVAVALAATHPWSGLAGLIVQVSFLSLSLLRHRNRETAHVMVAAIVACLAFGAYYHLFLNGFEQHRNVVDTWQLDWSVGWPTAAAAWGPVGLFAAIALYRRRRSLSDDQLFLLVALVTSLGLAFHDRIIPPIQPLHFTRGYIWLPLFLLGLPVIQEILRKSRTRVGAFAMVLIVTFAFLDNTAFVVAHAHRQYVGVDGFRLRGDSRALLDAAAELDLSGPTLCADAELCYLAATYTALRPVVGHRYITPRYEERSTEVQAFLDYRRGGTSLLRDVRYMIIPFETLGALRREPHRSDWLMRIRKGGLVLLERDP